MQDKPIDDQAIRKSLNAAYNVNGTIGALRWFQAEQNIVFSRPADDWIDIILDESTNNRGKAAGILNGLMGSCCQSPQQRLYAQFAKDLLQGLTVTAPYFKPDLVTLSLTYTAVKDVFPDLAEDIITGRHTGVDCETINPLCPTTANAPSFESLCWKENLENKFGIQILYDCPDFAVLDKPSGVPLTDTRTGRRTGSTSLDTALCEVGMSLSNLYGSCGFVHRLDAGTSGCLVVAKNNQAHCEWIARFFLRHVEKSYICLVDTSSRPQKLPPEGTIVLSLNGRPATSSYKVIAEFGQTASKLAIKTTQGRKHQVRIHCSKGLDTPIILDPRYGGERIMYRTKSHRLREARAKGRLCLHADTIAVPDLDLFVASCLPSWWDDVICEIMS